jgi:hypothetical protein
VAPPAALLRQKNVGHVAGAVGESQFQLKK